MRPSWMGLLSKLAIALRCGVADVIALEHLAEGLMLFTGLLRGSRHVGVCLLDEPSQISAIELLQPSRLCKLIAQTNTIVFARRYCRRLPRHLAWWSNAQIPIVREQISAMKKIF